MPTLTFVRGLASAEHKSRCGLTSARTGRFTAQPVRPPPRVCAGVVGPKVGAPHAVSASGEAESGGDPTHRGEVYLERMHELLRIVQRTRAQT